MSSTVPLPRDQVESIRPRDVQHYLTSRGWVADESDPSPNAAVYHHPASGDAEILLPLRQELRDYALGIADLVQTLGIVEDRSLLGVLADLSGPPSDMLRLRIAAPETTLGNLPLDEGIRLLRGGRDLLLSAACSAHSPRAYHAERTPRHAHDFLRKCRLGQTERGSFVATIITPIPQPFRRSARLAEDDVFEETAGPFARRVTTRLMASLDLVTRAIKTERIDPILAGIPQGVSANLCEALVAMKPTGDQSRLDLRMSWSRSRPRPPEGLPEVVAFAQSDFEIISEASRQLRTRPTPRRERFEGKVHSLQSGIATLFDDLRGKITIQTDLAGRSVRIKVALGRDDYHRACDAHRDEKRVAITGFIHHDVRIRVHELSEPSDFEVLDGD